METTMKIRFVRSFKHEGKLNECEGFTSLGDIPKTAEIEFDSKQVERLGPATGHTTIGFDADKRVIWVHDCFYKSRCIHRCISASCRMVAEIVAAMFKCRACSDCKKAIEGAEMFMKGFAEITREAQRVVSMEH
jgi:hypothetical protein